MSRWCRWLLLAVGAVLVAAVGAEAQTTHDVSISGSAFSPASMAVQPGDTIRWTNNDGFNHDVTQASGPVSYSAMNSGTMSPGAAHSFPIPGSAPPGTYTYYCSIHGGSMSGSFTIPGPANEAPTATSNSFSTPEDTAHSGQLSGSDPDGDDLTFSLVGSPSHGTADVGSAGSFTYTPNADYAGGDAFTFRVNDGQAQSSAATVSITVSAVNDAPVAAGHSFAVQSGQSHSGTLPSGTDVDHAPGELTYSEVAANDAHGTVTIQSNGAFTYQSTSGYSGAASFTYRVTDPDQAHSAPATVSVTVTQQPPANQPPTAQATQVTVAAGATVQGQLQGSDPDGDALTFSLVDPASAGTATVQGDGAFTYAADPQATGEDTFTFRVNDGEYDSGPATVTVTFSTPDAVQAEDQQASVTEDQELTGTVEAAGGSGTVTFSLATAPVNGEATVSTTGAFTYDPAADFHGTDSFEVTAQDASSSSTATVSISVTPVDDPPHALDAHLSVQQGGILVGTFEGSDVDGDALTFGLIEPAAHGAVVTDGVQFVYTPAATFSGADSFLWGVTDGRTMSTAHVHVTVEAGTSTATSTSSASATSGDQGLAATDDAGSPAPVALVFVGLWLARRLHR